MDNNSYQDTKKDFLPAEKTKEKSTELTCQYRDRGNKAKFVFNDIGRAGMATESNTIFS